MRKRYRRKRTKQRAKSVRLNQLYWLRNASDIKQYREELLAAQGGVCAITGIPLETGVLDHCHDNGRCRGVIDMQVNGLEGRYLSLFKKSRIGEKYNLTFPEFLINLGTYLQKDNSDKPLHFKLMDDKRRQVSRLTRPELIKLCEKEFDIEIDSSILVKDIVQIYMQMWVDKLEDSLKC